MYFLTSQMDTFKVINGEKIAKIMDNRNNLIEQLKSSINKYENFVFVANNPNSHDITKIYADLMFQSFELSGMKFENYVVLDNLNKERTKELIENADVVFLAGGHVPTQNDFLHEIKLKELLKDFKGVVIGQSAGSMNMSNKVYNYPSDNDELNDPKYMDGLGLIDINIVPHFDLVNGNPTDGTFDVMKIFKEDSYHTPLYCIMDGSHVSVDNGNVVFHGEAYLMKDGNITPINK